MRLLRTILIASLVSAPIIPMSACGSSGGGDVQPFDTFQACFDDHHNVEGFTPDRAIEICCIDHPIGTAKENVVCGETVQACQTYVTANLTPASATTDQITNACTNYVPDRGG